MGFSSQANDIGNICDAVSNNIKQDVSALSTATTGASADAYDQAQLLRLILANLQEVNLHLRIMNEVDPSATPEVV